MAKYDGVLPRAPAYSILRNETKRNETKYMGEGEKTPINLNTA